MRSSMRSRTPHPRRRWRRRSAKSTACWQSRLASVAWSRRQPTTPPSCASCRICSAPTASRNASPSSSSRGSPAPDRGRQPHEPATGHPAMNLLLAPETWPFAVAGLLMLSIAAIEGIALLIGASAMGWVDSLLHHSPDALLHHSPDAPDTVDRWQGLLHLVKVPRLLLLGLYLAQFELIGFAPDLAAAAVYGTMI